MEKSNFKRILQATLLSVLIIVVSAAAVSASENLSVHFLDVGQGDSELLQIAGKYDDAIRCYEEAIRLGPKYGAPWNNKAIAIYQNKLLTKSCLSFGAIPDLNQYVAIYKNKLPTTLNDYLVSDQDNYSSTLDCLNTSINLNPYLATAWYNKGLILYLQGKYYNSEKCFEKAINLRSSYPQAWNNKGLALFSNALKLDQYNREPRQCFENALKMDPSMAEAWNNIGLANYQNADCTRYFDKAIDLGFVSALNNKARVYDFWQRDDEALTLYNKALKLDPDNSIIWKNRDDIDRTHSGIHYIDMGHIGLILTPSPPMLVP